MYLVEQNISYQYYVIRLSYPSSRNSNIYISKFLHFWWQIPLIFMLQNFTRHRRIIVKIVSTTEYPFHVITAFGHYKSNKLMEFTVERTKIMHRLMPLSHDCVKQL
jgi:hypothetical protein